MTAWREREPKHEAARQDSWYKEECRFKDKYVNPLDNLSF